MAKKATKTKDVRGGIAQHATGWSDADYDGETQLARVRENQQREYYRGLFAWEDPAADLSAVSTYKFLHHLVDEGGEAGDASTIAAIRGIVELNSSSRGEIPEDDARDVWTHLAKHLRDAGKEPPPLVGPDININLRRNFKVSALRIHEGEDGKPMIQGHAAVFNSLSLDLGGFRETIKPGAFAKTIRESDVRALWNHDENFVLGRTKSGTLRLREDDTGLAVEIDPPDAQWARDFMESIRRGDVDQMSFGFNTIIDRWFEEGGEMRRELIEVRLFDTSPVTFPAYPATDVGIRALAEDLGLNFGRLSGALKRSREGKLMERDLTVLRSAVDAIKKMIPEEPGQVPHSDEDAPGEDAQVVRSRRTRELDLIAAEIA